MTSSFSFIRNKLGVASFIVLASLFVSSVTKANVFEVSKHTLTEAPTLSLKEHLVVSIHKIDNTYYVVLNDLTIKQPCIDDKNHQRRTLKKTEDMSSKLPLNISRGEVKRRLKNSLLLDAREDFLQQ